MNDGKLCVVLFFFFPSCCTKTNPENLRTCLFSCSSLRDADAVGLRGDLGIDVFDRYPRGVEKHVPVRDGSAFLLFTVCTGPCVLMYNSLNVLLLRGWCYHPAYQNSVRGGTEVKEVQGQVVKRTVTMKNGGMYGRPSGQHAASRGGGWLCDIPQHAAFRSRAVWLTHL